MTEGQTTRRHLVEIVQAGLRRVDPYRMLMAHVRLDDRLLRVRWEDGETTLDLKPYARIVVFGVGKAAAPMAKAMEEILGPRLAAGLIVVKYGHTVPLQRVETLEAGHPVPDANGLAAARRILSLADAADAATLVIGLISGGGSALLPLPLEGADGDGAPEIRLADKQRTTQALLACGADIAEINCVRKHISQIKGGRLLAHLAPARNLNFILSDVVGDDLASIASGLTVPDPTTYADALAIIDRYQIGARVPSAVRRALAMGEEGRLPETLKPGDPAADRTTNVLIGTNRIALMAAAAEAQRLGFTPLTLTARVTGEAREAARFLAAIGADAAGEGLPARGPACILSGGEPVVTLRGRGKGGRNQEMALAFLAEMARQPDLYRNVCFLAAATDGNDGPTDAAGAFADLTLLEAARRAGLDLQAYLQDNDAYHFFKAIDGLFQTGPTNTNVCDLHVMLIGGA
jgi:glycerate 2-kinase